MCVSERKHTGDFRHPSYSPLQPVATHCTLEAPWRASSQAEWQASSQVRHPRCTGRVGSQSVRAHGRARAGTGWDTVGCGRSGAPYFGRRQTLSSPRLPLFPNLDPLQLVAPAFDAMGRGDCIGLRCSLEDRSRKEIIGVAGAGTDRDGWWRAEPLAGAGPGRYARIGVCPRFHARPAKPQFRHHPGRRMGFRASMGRQKA